MCQIPAQWDKYTARHQTAGQQRDFEKGDCVSVRVDLRVLYRLGQTHARPSGSFLCVAQLPKRMMGRRMRGQGKLSLEALGVCLAQPSDFSAHIVLIQVVIHRPAGS